MNRKSKSRDSLSDAAASAEMVNPGRRVALRCLGSGALLPLAALPLASVAQSVPAYPPAPGAPLPLLPDCHAEPRNITAMGVSFPFTDPLNDLKAVFDFGLNLIPGVGGAIAVIFDLLFPSSSGPNLWDQIKDKINSMIEHAIEDTVINAMQMALRGSSAPSASPGGLQAMLDTFLRDINAYKPGGTLLDGEAISIREFFIDQVGIFQPSGWEWQTLPLFTQFANLHLLFLREVTRHGQNYGVKPDTIAALQSDIDGYVDSQGVQHDGCVKQYCQYVDACMSGIRNKLQQDQAAAQPIDWRTGKNLEVYAGQNGDTDNYGFVAVALWAASKKRNSRLSVMTHSVQDFRDLWPTMMNPDGSGISLLRELYLGPFGAPDIRDLGIELDWNLGTFNGVPPIPEPIAATGPALGYVSVPCTDTNTQGRRWAFPNSISSQPMSDTFGISLSDQFGGPVVGVRVDVGKYISRTSNPWSSMPCSAGYLIDEIYFTQKDGGTHAVGGDGRVYKEMKSFTGEVLDIPSGNMLSGITVTSTVKQLYSNVDNHGKTSIGSLIFGFKLIHPDLPVRESPGLLRSLFVTAGGNEPFAAVVDVVRRHEASHGRAFSLGEAMAFLRKVTDLVEAYDWDAERNVFQSRLVQSGADR